MNLVDDPGPEWKHYPVPNTAEGVILHSMEGSWAASRERLMSDAQVSWHFSILTSGEIRQHYALDVSCWHAGNGPANRKLVGIEHEGRAGEALTAPQLAASVELVRWIAMTKGWAMARHVTLWEHNEWTLTQCPSGRIPWDRYKEADVLSPPPKKEDAGLIGAAIWLYGQPSSPPGVAIEPQEMNGNRRTYLMTLPPGQ